jgi:uncharacterized membrane protein YdfJ with MMPL/SSD domain
VAAGASWVVLALWVVVVAVAGPLSVKLNGAQQNDASAWLPRDAESTQVIELAKQFTPSDTLPAVVVYERPGPITRADQARAAADAERFIVRSVLVTALNLDVGRWIWWPSRLARKRDVELEEVGADAAALAR